LKELKECYRVHALGGVLRVICPDLLIYVKAYVARDSSFYDSHLIRMACSYEGLTTFDDRLLIKPMIIQTTANCFMMQKALLNY
jgi:hypothetical protein